MMSICRAGHAADGSACTQVSYQTALAAVCVEGILFIILAVTGLRLRLIRLVPKSIMLATSAGRRPAGSPH